MRPDAGAQRGIVITGASRGLGEALAVRYAEAGIHLGLLGRDAARLSSVARACRERGAAVTADVVDIKDHAALTAWTTAFDRTAPIELLIVNAGLFTGHAEQQRETADEIVELVRTNLEAAILTIDAALPMLRARRHGTIAIVGSLAALHPLADAPTYSATKAGIIAYGEALREWLAPDNVGVSLIYPGHIRTQQVANHIGQLPLLMSAEHAAEIIKRGLDRKRTFIAFPRRLYWLIQMGRLVPWRVRAFLGASMRFHVAK